MGPTLLSFRVWFGDFSKMVPPGALVTGPNSWRNPMDPARVTDLDGGLAKGGVHGLPHQEAARDRSGIPCQSQTVSKRPRNSDLEIGKHRCSAGRRDGKEWFPLRSAAQNASKRLQGGGSVEGEGAHGRIMNPNARFVLLRDFWSTLPSRRGAERARDGAAEGRASMPRATRSICKPM